MYFLQQFVVKNTQSKKLTLIFYITPVAAIATTTTAISVLTPQILDFLERLCYNRNIKRSPLGRLLYRLFSAKYYYLAEFFFGSSSRVLRFMIIRAN